MASMRLVLMVPSDLNSPVREIDRSSPYKNLVLAHDDTEDWSACDDAKMRRRVQNRLNQRAKSKLLAHSSIDSMQFRCLTYPQHSNFLYLYHQESEKSQINLISAKERRQSHGKQHQSQLH